MIFIQFLAQDLGQHGHKSMVVTILGSQTSAGPNAGQTVLGWHSQVLLAMFWSSSFQTVVLEAHHHHGNLFLAYWNISWAYVSYIMPRIQNLPKSEAHGADVIIAKGSSETQKGIPLCSEGSFNAYFCQMPNASLWACQLSIPLPSAPHGFQSLSGLSGLKTLRTKAPCQSSVNCCGGWSVSPNPANSHWSWWFTSTDGSLLYISEMGLTWGSAGLSTWATPTTDRIQRVPLNTLFGEGMLGTVLAFAVLTGHVGAGREIA